MKNNYKMYPSKSKKGYIILLLMLKYNLQKDEGNYLESLH